MNPNSKNRIINYYQSLESFLGYKFLTWETKHFGFYPKKRRNVREREAQRLMMDEVAKSLHLKKDEKVLDAGCGYGTTSLYLADKYEVCCTGIDINKFEIEKAKEKARSRDLAQKVDFHLRDYSNTHFPDNYFDKLFTLETLSHASDLKKTLKEFYRILKPGGKLALFEYTIAPKSDFTTHDWTILRSGIEDTAAFGLYNFLHDFFPRYLSTIGFTYVKERNITQNFLPSLERLKRIATLPYFFIEAFHLQKYFVNTTIAVEWYHLVKKDLLRYCIFTAEK